MSIRQANTGPDGDARMRPSEMRNRTGPSGEAAHTSPDRVHEQRVAMAPGSRGPPDARGDGGQWPGDRT